MTDENYQMIEDCEKRQSKLSYSELKFVYDMRMRLDVGKGLTEKHAKKLEKICDRLTP